VSEHRLTDPLRPGDDDAVGRLIAEAGPRPPLPETDLAAIAAAARAAWQARSAPGAPPAAAPDRDRVADAAAERPARRGSSRPLTLALAAVVLACALGLVFWATRGSGGGAPEAARLEAATGPVSIDRGAGRVETLAIGDPIPAGARLRTGPAAAPGADGRPVRASLRTTAGATVRLDEGTAVRLTSAGGLDLDSGAVYVASGGRRGARVEVRTAIGTARDIGTQFIVRVDDPATPAERPAALHVLVREGAVALDVGGDRHLASAGEELRVRNDGSLERRPIPAFGPDWQWVLAAAAPFDPQGRTVAELLDWVSMETGWTVRYQDEAAAASAREASLRGGGPAWEATWRALRADEAPALVLPSADLESELRNGVLTVRRKR
jgi:ferric-dicitrate binding protein FerR (iron transport regulator)